MSDFKEYLNKSVEEINTKIDECIGNCNYGEPVVYDAMKYSLKNGGKRIRPILVYEFCRLLNGDTELCTSPANAIEMIHTYSLIHDDLPCMDNDDMRRGKPSCHIAYGENFALLAGDGLLTKAFSEISNSNFAKKHPDRAIKCIQILSDYSGIDGMIGGQVIDLQNENNQSDIETLALMDSLKTGALIKAACMMGVVCANGSETDLKNAELYAEKLGKAFQIVDDILDVTADEKELGKPVGSDAESNKSTYVSLLGLEESQKLADQLTNEAVDILKSYGTQADFLIELTKALAYRKK